MPTFDQHLEQANRNYRFLNTFILKDHHDWAMTVMFYTSLHLVEGLMYKEVNRLRNEEKWGYLEIDCSNHNERERQVKDIMEEIHFPFSQLRKFAYDGRYKIYKFRESEIFISYVKHFTPIADFFNAYCKKYSIQSDFALKQLNYKLA
jgi:hypothetical protein